MERLIELMKDENQNFRLSNYDLWLYWDEVTEAWIVRKPARNRIGSVVLAADSNLNNVIELLVKER